MKTELVVTCAKCGDEFIKLVEAIQHCVRKHGMTHQQAQNELKLHRRG